EELPASFELISAYPNPFNPTTTVTLRVNQADEIAIELFDVIGRRVKVFGATYFPAGEHGVRVDAAGLPSGAYWIRATGTRHSAGRMVLLQK
ncbi:MAG: T9SS type A sorting domain-containing protein, partial [Candidatus Paceibacterota bacterium]